MVVLLSATGCSNTVGGAARPPANLAPRFLDGQTLKRVLLGKSALSRVVRQPLELDPGSPPLVGGPETFGAAPAEGPESCLGVAVMMQAGAYRSANVNAVAFTTWRPTVASGAAVTRVQEAAISLPTAADANALFATFSRQWHECDGKTVPIVGGTLPLEVKVSDVQSATSVVAATISTEWSAPGFVSPSVPAARAIGVRDNCLVEVEVDFVDSPGVSLEGSSALDIAQVMRDKVSALS
ncbi:sensor domain-containing protein [Mycobacterium paraffinicum]|uniref:Sensor domain-containing protein n=1 Tax=Mycobacterium paraffinicum TaxID=53378 RepID=A0ABP8F7L4_9MYCO